MKSVLHIALGLLLVTACRKAPDTIAESNGEVPFPLELLSGFPFPPIAEGNPLTISSVQLGKALFFEPRLSRDGTVSCNSCHSTTHAFSDTMALSMGIDGQLGMRNAPTLGNVAYHPYFFRDGGVPTLEQQVIAPIQDPVEMDHHIQNEAVALRDVEPYASLSIKAYGRPIDAYVVCLLYTSDAADERSSVDLGGRRIIKKKKRVEQGEHH